MWNVVSKLEWSPSNLHFGRVNFEHPPNPIRLTVRSRDGVEFAISAQSPTTEILITAHSDEVSPSVPNIKKVHTLEVRYSGSLTPNPAIGRTGQILLKETSMRFEIRLYGCWSIASLLRYGSGLR